MFGFKFRDKLGSQGLLIDTVPVSIEIVESDAPYDVVQLLIKFTNHALQVSHFLADEILPEIFYVYQVDYYIAQVNNGGHGQYVGNSGIWQSSMKPTTKSCRNGLAAIGANTYVAIYDDLLALLASDPHRAKKIADGRGFGEIDPTIEELDKRFFTQDSTHLMSLNRAWLLAQPWVEIVADDVLNERAGEILGRNNLAEARRKVAGS